VSNKTKTGPVTCRDLWPDFYPSKTVPSVPRNKGDFLTPKYYGHIRGLKSSASCVRNKRIVSQLQQAYVGMCLTRQGTVP